jgi:hypothetical protein
MHACSANAKVFVDMHLHNTTPQSIIPQLRQPNVMTKLLFMPVQKNLRTKPVAVEASGEENRQKG